MCKRPGDKVSFLEMAKPSPPLPELLEGRDLPYLFLAPLYFRSNLQLSPRAENELAGILLGL